MTKDKQQNSTSERHPTPDEERDYGAVLPGHIQPRSTSPLPATDKSALEDPLADDPFGKLEPRVHKDEGEDL